jgi:hypothetical protein
MRRVYNPSIVHITNGIAGFFYKTIEVLVIENVAFGFALEPVYLDCLPIACEVGKPEHRTRL